MGGPRWWGVLREGLHQGGPLSRLCCPLGGKVSGQSPAVPESLGAGEIQPFVSAHWPNLTVASTLFLLITYADDVQLYKLLALCEKQLIHLFSM